MKTLSAGTPVKSGHYFNLKTWTLTPVEADGEQLPGERGEEYIHLPLALAVMATPILGATFLMFMPAIGFYLVAKAAIRPLLSAVHKTTEELAATMSPGLVPGEAHLTGKPGEKAEGKAAETKELELLQAEIDAKRTPKA